MEGRLIFALLVSFALAEYGLGNHEGSQKDEVRRDNLDDVNLNNIMSDDEILMKKFDKTLLKLAAKFNDPKKPQTKRQEVGVGSDSELNTQCNDQIVIQDGRHFKCIKGDLVPCRVRREFVTGLTDEERAHYIATVKTAATQLPYKTRYEELLSTHKEFFNFGIHHGNTRIRYFLPWHRWFILQYENLLREIDPKITAVYWDWSLVGGAPFESEFWAKNNTGFGGNGNPPGECVDTGPFQEELFSVIESAGGGCLTRNFSGVFPNSVHVAILLYQSNLFTFEAILESIYHDNIHDDIGGIMVSHDAASAPEFFLHHGFMDKTWSDWQKRGYDDSYYFHVPYVMPASCNLPKEFLDLTNQPGDVCVVYEDPKSEIYRELRSMTFSELKEIPTYDLPKISRTAIQLFKIPELVLQIASTFRAEVKTKQRKSKLTGTDEKLGFCLADLKKVRAAAKASRDIQE